MEILGYFNQANFTLNWKTIKAASRVQGKYFINIPGEIGKLTLFLDVSKRYHHIF